MSSILPETRVRILKAARKLLEESRGKPVRMVDIARAADVSRQAVYLEFENRSRLVADTREFVDQEYGVEEKLAVILQNTSATAKLQAYIAFWADYLPNIYGLARAMQLGSATDEAAALAWQECQEDHFAVCLNIANQLEQEKVLASGWTVNDAAEVISVLLSLEGWAELVQNRNWDKEKYISHMKSMAIGGLKLQT